jgi:hypothetical protein
MSNIFIGRQRGGAKVGCLALVLLWGILGYLSYRIVPVFMDKDAYIDDLLNVAGRASIGQWDDRRTMRLVLDVSKSRDFEVTREDVEIKHVMNRPEVWLIVNFRRTLEFPGGYEYVFHFKTTAQGSLGW